MDWLSDMTNTSIERESLLPSSRFFFPNSIEEEQDREEAIEAARDAETVVLTDPDTDGLGAVLALRQAYSGVEFVSCGPHSSRLDIDDGIEIVTEYADEGVDVFIVDMCPDDSEDLLELSDMSDHAGTVRWFDHHDWDGGLQMFVSNRVDELIVNEGDHKDPDTPTEKCAAEITRDWLIENGFEIPDTVYEAITVTGIYDCWRKETDENGEDTLAFMDERARDLSDYCSVSEPSEYLTVVSDHGADIMENDEVSRAVESYRNKQDELLELAVDRVEEHHINGWKVATVYGRAPTNDVADYLRDSEDFDLIVHIKPSGGIGLRGSEDFERCSEIADSFDGGGHGRAAGCFIAPKNDGDQSRWDTDMLDYADHWISQGEKSKQLVLEEIEKLE